MNPLSPEQQEAKQLVAEYWAILMDKDREMLLLWMSEREKYGVPLVAKQCAILAVEKILKCPLESTALEDGNLRCPSEHYEKVKQALIAM